MILKAKSKYNWLPRDFRYQDLNFNLNNKRVSRMARKKKKLYLLLNVYCRLAAIDPIYWTDKTSPEDRISIHGAKSLSFVVQRLTIETVHTNFPVIFQQNEISTHDEKLLQNTGLVSTAVFRFFLRSRNGFIQLPHVFQVLSDGGVLTLLSWQHFAASRNRVSITC